MEIIISFLPTGIIAYADHEINMLRLCKSVIFPPFVLKMSQNHISKSTRTSRNALKSTLSRLHGINISLSATKSGGYFLSDHLFFSSSTAFLILAHAS